MKWETFQSTPGLDRIPPGKRFATYRGTHQRLLREDESYRKRHNHYVISYSILIAAAFLGVSTLGLVSFTLLSLAATAVVVYLAFREQRQMNQCIGRVLQSQPR
ncbi:hypothetical protein CfE428DRAFT_3951 [Chthoniobacter flavus Ellin428]|uniref:Uncharacterized protein n=1 Tax=Chthoniobacter flavus Ellin428 TaxID=497964 RepID=B4D4W3_9BACT|nr:hypothetical protein [Chthoniobacter flavus]EDY18566.1 hypothetical protein CfE428DRAFT_3951 [Chthoniobacter flavus Ellin428]TCO90979.1 hypothetical protein EV701_109129 [Chthoniobacter flavus]